jgi:hypothetical protein
LNPHFQNPELVGVEANEVVSLGLEIGQPEVGRFVANSQLGPTQREWLVESETSI